MCDLQRAIFEFAPPPFQIEVTGKPTVATSPRSDFHQRIIGLLWCGATHLIQLNLREQHGRRTIRTVAHCCILLRFRQSMELGFSLDRGILVEVLVARRSSLGAFGDLRRRLRQSPRHEACSATSGHLLYRLRDRNRHGYVVTVGGKRAVSLCC